MMAKINFPEGQSPTVGLTVRGRHTTRLFTNVGLAEAPTVNLTAQATRMSALVVDDNPLDSLTITSLPSRGRAMVRPDPISGFIVALDLTQEAGNDASDITISYDKEVSSVVTNVVDQVITVLPSKMRTGFAPGKYYLPETDSNDAIIVDPSDGSRKIHVSLSGLDAAAIAALEPGLSDSSDVNGTWLVNNIANGETDHYGATQALEVTPVVGAMIWDELADDIYAEGVHLLFDPNDDFPDIFEGKVNRLRAKSWLHPHLIGTYDGSVVDGHIPTGSGNTPAWGVVYQGIKNKQRFGLGRTSRVVADRMLFQDGLLGTAGDSLGYGYGCSTTRPAQHLTIRRGAGWDVYRPRPLDPDLPSWGMDSRNDRRSLAFINGYHHLLMEKIFSDRTGWGPDYNVAGDLAHGHPPSQYSHGIYEQGTNLDKTARDLIITRPSHSPYQNRSAGTTYRCVFAGQNGAFNPSRGGEYAGTGVEARVYTDDIVISWAGFKQTMKRDLVTPGMLKKIGAGVNATAFDSSMMSTLVINAGSSTPITSLADIGPIGAATDGGKVTPYNPDALNDGEYGYTFYDDYVVYNWEKQYHPDENATGVPAEMDGATFAAYNDQWKSATGSTNEDFCNNMRLEAAPWEQIDDLLEFFQTPFGKWKGRRTVAQTVTWEPVVTGDAASATPGYQAWIDRDWDTGDLPGTVAGDNIAIPGGYFVRWNQTPKNALGGLTLGGGVDLEIYGGALRVTDTTVTGAGTKIEMFQGSKFDIGSYSDTDFLEIAATDSRFVNTGSVTGDLDLTLYGPAEAVLCQGDADFTIKSGRTLAVGGMALAGFDGTSGTGSVTQNGTLAFTTSCLMVVEGMLNTSSSDTDLPISTTGFKRLTNCQRQPLLGSIVTGQTSGATGRVADILPVASGNTTGMLKLDNVTGVFTAGENLVGQSTIHQMTDPVADQVIGTVPSAVDYSIGAVREFRSGENGWAVPNVTSQWTLESGSDVTVSAIGLASGTYDLIDVDSLTNNGATLSAGVAVVGNKLVLTVS